VGDVVGPEWRGEDEDDDQGKEAEEGQRHPIAPQAPPGEAPGPRGRSGGDLGIGLGSHPRSLKQRLAAT